MQGLWDLGFYAGFQDFGPHLFQIDVQLTASLTAHGVFIQLLSMSPVVQALIPSP
jgi:hypothetical protein